MPDLAIDQRIVAGAAATLRFTPYDQDGEPVAPSGTTTIAVVTSGGSSLSSGTATNGATECTYALTASETETLETLTATWTKSSVDYTTTIAITGRPYCTVTDAREIDRAFAELNVATSRLIEIREAVEAECEMITGRSFVPRHRRVELPAPGSRELVLDDVDIRSVASVTETSSSNADTVLSDALDESAWRAGIIRKLDGTKWYSTGTLIVDYTHGMDRPPRDVVEAFVRRWRWWATQATSNVPARAVSFSAEGGGTFRLATPGRFATGDPEVDGVYGRYIVKPYGVA